MANEPKQSAYFPMTYCVAFLKILMFLKREREREREKEREIKR